MMFNESWLSELMEMQKKATEMAKNKNSADEIQGLVKSVLGQWGISGFPWEQSFQSGGFPRNEPFEEKTDSPSHENHYNIDISEQKESVQIQIQIPGIGDPHDLQIKLGANTLHIAAAIKGTGDNEGSFSRKIRLPSEVTLTGASAVYKDNCLTVILPKIPPEGENIPFDFYPSP